MLIRCLLKNTFILLEFYNTGRPQRRISKQTANKIYKAYNKYLNTE